MSQNMFYRECQITSPPGVLNQKVESRKMSKVGSPPQNGIHKNWEKWILKSSHGVPKN